MADRRWLEREVALLGGRVAAALRREPSAGLADAVGFLASMGAAAGGSSDLDGLRRGELAAAPADEPLVRLVTALGLSPLEIHLVLLAGMAEEHEGYAEALRRLHPSGQPLATVALAAQALCREASERWQLRRTLESGVAVRAGLIRLVDDAPFPERNLHLADRVWPVLHGIDVWPVGLRRLPAVACAAGLERWLDGAAVRAAVQAIASPTTLLVQAEVDETAAERALAVVEAAGQRAVRLLWSAGAGPEVEKLAGLHALARRVVPVLQLASSDGPGGAEVPRFEDHPGPVVVCGRVGQRLRGGRTVVTLSCRGLRPSERRAMWREVVPELAADAGLLAARYAVEPALALAATADARATAARDGRALALADLASGVRARSAAAVLHGVKIVRPTARWDMLVLAPERRLILRESLDRLLGQSRVLDEWRFLDGRPGARGVRMLFAGPSGTGKTLTAEILAAELDVDLLVVDISRVVSKWIGETEKNLAQVFDVAEQSTSVLLFDEADALFGKRTQVSDAHDRYANLETAYLLSRLERFEGLAILSTNLRQDIDPAFMRRLEFVVEFPEPSPEDRLTLWQRHMPAGAPLADDVDFVEMASLFPVVGGLIRNAAVAAAFLASAEGASLARRHLVHAMRREYAKAGRAFPEHAPELVAR